MCHHSYRAEEQSPFEDLIGELQRDLVWKLSNRFLKRVFLYTRFLIAVLNLARRLCNFPFGEASRFRFQKAQKYYFLAEYE